MDNPNQAQADFWSGDVAKKWLDREAEQRVAFAGVATTLIEAADISDGLSVLDIGCGNGDSTFLAAQQTSTRVTGADISALMLERARKHATDRKVSHVEFVEADAQTYDFDRGAYDRMISRFGMMFFADPASAFANIATALKPGGTMTFITWGPPDKNPWFGLPRKITEDYFGPSPRPDPNSPGPFGFANAVWVLDQMSRAGLDGSVQQVEVALTPGKSVTAVAESMSLGPISASVRERGGTAEDLKFLTDALAKALETFETAGGVQIPSMLNLFSAKL